MRIGFNGKLDDPAFTGRIDLLREMGVEALDVQAREIDADTKAFVTAARDKGIPVEALAPPWGWTDRALKDQGEIERMIAFIRELPALGIDTMNLSCSVVKPQTDSERQTHLSQLVDVFRTVCPVAEAAGVNLCSHTTLFRRGILFGSVEGVDAFLEGVGSERNKILLCCGCVSAAGEDVPSLIHHWGQSIGSVHLFNPLGNRDHYEEMRFDKGQMDMVQVFRALADIGYDGMLIPHEYPPFQGPTGQAVSDGWTLGYIAALRQTLG